MSRIYKRQLGAVMADNGMAEIRLWAPNAEAVSLLTMEDNKRIEMKPEEFGYWNLKTDKLKPGAQYKFVLNQDKEFPDPASLSQPEGVHGPSRFLDLSNFAWDDNDWKNLPLPEYVIYELHSGTFTPEGTFESLEDKLDYLRELGITAIEIMPVAQFPGKRNWGYDGVYPFAVQHSYGGAEKLQHLVNTCHKKGLAVILDVVYNHLGPEGNYLEAYGPYFTEKYNTPWGKAINFDDAWCDGVRHYFIENVLMWFRDFHIDALRMDAIHAIKDLSPVHILKEIRQHVDELMEHTGKPHYLIIECDLNDQKFINPAEKDGYGMDAQWIDEFHHSLRVTAGEERTGYYADFDGIEHLAKAYNEAYVYNGIYSPHRNKFFGTTTEGNPGHQFIIFSQNHDQVGNRMLGERTSELVSFEMQKLMAGAVMASPFLPMLFMGEEWSASSPFQYFVSHTDPDLVEAVRKGRKAEFEAFHAKGEAPDPQSEETFLRSKLNWEEISKDHHQVMLSYYKELISLRKNHPVLKHLIRENVNVQCDSQNQILSLYRWYGKEHIICLMNFSSETQEVQVPFQDGSVFIKLLDSAAPQWNGPAAAPETLQGNSVTEIQPESLIIFTISQDV